jgi:hypothetical protein
LVAGINFQLCELGSHYRISPPLLRIKERKERKNKVIVPLDMTKRPYIPQQDVSYMAGYSVAIKNSFLNLVPPRGTDWRFKSPPHPIHTRCAPGAERVSVYGTRQTTQRLASQTCMPTGIR